MNNYDLIDIYSNGKYWFCMFDSDELETPITYVAECSEYMQILFESLPDSINTFKGEIFRIGIQIDKYFT